MANLRESDVKFNIKELFKEYNVWYFMPSMNGYGRAGVPDFIACVNGRFLAVEAKGHKGKPTLNQEREIKAIQDNKGTAIIIDDTNIKFLEEILSGLVHL